MQEGIFRYKENGFEITIDNKVIDIAWSSIEQITAYKADLMTTDEVRMQITLHDQTIHITEETEGYNTFVEKINAELPGINPNREASVQDRPFEDNYTVVYERG